MLFKQEIPAMPFRQWLWQDKENRLLLKIAAVVIVVQFAVFKWLYPFPNFMPPDSDGYVEAAYYNYSINIWAIGYSKFLRLISCFSKSHLVLVWTQYLLLYGYLLYFLYTIKYLLRPSVWCFRLAIACSILNPLFPHISNFVSSDALFTTLSLLWFTQLLWILYKPIYRVLIFHAFVLLMAFMVRYNAVFYPFVSILVIAYGKLLTRRKVVSIGLILFLLAAFVGHTMYRYYLYTGRPQYTAFGGWQIAANALYGYAYARRNDTLNVPPEFKQLHRIVNRHMDSIRHFKLANRPDREVAIYYLWDDKSPLVEYLENYWRRDTTMAYFKVWGMVAPLYSRYGDYLIRKYPWLFVKYYMWPNLIKYYAPPTKFMGTYNLGRVIVSPIEKKWFGLNSNKVYTRFNVGVISVTEYFSVISAIVNLVFLLIFITFIGLKCFRKCTTYSRRIVVLIFIVWMGNMVFSVFAAPIELRYQLFPITITFVFAVLMIECLVREFDDKKFDNR